MLPEALVIFACIKSTGCPQTSSLYFSQNPEFKKTIDQDYQKARNYIGPTLVDTVGPALYYVAGGTGVIHLNKYFSMELKRGEGMLIFRFDLP